VHVFVPEITPLITIANTQHARLNFAMADRLLDSALEHLAQTPADWFLGNMDQDRALPLRSALAQAFAYRAANAKAKWRKGRPHAIKEAEALDGEQIYALMALWDEPVLQWCDLAVDALEDAPGAKFKLREEGEEDEFGEDEDEFGEEEDFEGEEEEELEELEELEDGDVDDDEEEDDRGKSDKGAVAAAPVNDPLLDDDYFHVSEMDQFAEEVEARMEKEYEREAKRLKKLEQGKRDEDDDDDDSYDSAMENEDYEEDDEKFAKSHLYSAADSEGLLGLDADDEDENARYEDFFGAAANGAGKKTAAPKVVISKQRQKTKDELRSRIEALENEALSEKPWELRGEAKSTTRPVDSLLEKGDVEINVVKASTPALTPEVAKEIEAYILKRVLEGKYDDVHAVARDKDREALPFRAVLSSEKSKDGLAETYAKDYEEKVLDRTPKAALDTEKERAEIRDMFAQLCQKLDALSNFHFTPKPPKPAKDSNRPPDVAAVHMEDVMPTTETGGASQVAPEEVKRVASGLGKSREEMEPEERRAARRAKKSAHKKKRVAEGKPAEIPTKKKKKMSKAEDDDKADKTKWTSSAQVFRKMQDARERDE
jgi:U3 small nucleolar RNA-associated protein MPP10